MTLNAFNPLFQVMAALIIFVVGFFVLFVSVLTAMLLGRLGYLGASWAVSKSAMVYSQRTGALGGLVAQGNGASALDWRDRLADSLAPKL
jgi:hypothetical protein